MSKQIGLLMVGEGLLSGDDLERAVRRKTDEGGSLALNLVLEGAVDELRLAKFYVQKMHLDPVPEETLDKVDDMTFSLIPLEIIYDSGILPLKIKDEDTLVVGLVDPTDRELIAEATFFCGYNLELNLITVSQMAYHFFRLAKQPWKIRPDEAMDLMRTDPSSPVAAQVDKLLEQTEMLDQQIEEELESSLDVTYQSGDEIPSSKFERTPSVVMAGSVADEISELQIGNARLDETGPHAAISDATSPLRRIQVPADAIAEMGLADSGALSESKVVEGEAVTSAGPMRVLGIKVGAALQQDPGVLRPVITDRVSQFKERPKTKVPSRAASTNLDASIENYLLLLTRMASTLTSTDEGAATAVDQLRERLAAARKRNELGDAILDSMAQYFQSTVVFTLNGPRAVIWRANLNGVVRSEKVGEKIELATRGILHRISEERLFYWGPLSASSPLRKVLEVDHNHNVLFAPVELRSKTILIVYFDSGTDVCPAPGSSLERLLVDLSKGLERVILLRKRGRRKAAGK